MSHSRTEQSSDAERRKRPSALKHAPCTAPWCPSNSAWSFRGFPSKRCELIDGGGGGGGCEFEVM